MKIGYARVSTEDQSLDAQRAQLRLVGCARVFSEKLTGRTRNRPALIRALASLKAGDTLVVWKLDRLGRSVKNLVDTLQELEARGVRFCSISDGIDTGTPSGRLMFHLLGAIAEFEASLIAERTRLGMEDARRKGQHLGRPRRLRPHQVRQARRLRYEENLSPGDIARKLNVGRTTVWRAIRNHEA
ncbi:MULTISPECIES: recombinase family protein [unclassified Variovorax]|uniref:recombinase family protein n=1 Tax=unclassified Variovorax TaxID=663243 RepID=UPI00076C76AE|nr:MULTISPECIES: recombinase family protein [unclassified Variovorax]KWT91742.1 Site-specific recombinase [Variovorax sp. WDL1]PNG53315.1 DNA-invertase hin [Variovorax sp. B2]PNG53887.1 DNA-invertase hin [Variovorax sp. B4]VTV11352.1 DNA-invertase hin [Variovorax sp. WDL1]